MSKARRDDQAVAPQLDSPKQPMTKFVIQKVGLSTILAWMLLGGAFVAAISGMITLAYNLTARLFGGIEIELREEIPTVVPLDGSSDCTHQGTQPTLRVRSG